MAKEIVYLKKLLSILGFIESIDDMGEIYEVSYNNVLYQLYIPFHTDIITHVNLYITSENMFNEKFHSLYTLTEIIKYLETKFKYLIRKNKLKKIITI